MNPVVSRTECEEIVGRLWPHLDGALAEAERTRVIDHLASCTGCRSHYDFARAFLEAVRGAASDDAEFAGLRGRVQLTIAEARRAGR